MPNDPGSSSFLPAQYEKLVDGLSKVADPNRATILRAQSGLIVDPGKHARINIPAWDSILRLGARPVVTEQDWTTHRAFERARLPSPLAPELQAEIRRRRDAADDIRNSAIPEYAAGLSQVINAIDNVQDFALTVAVAGRIALFAAGRVGAHFVPFLGPIMTVAAILNWLAWGAVALGPLYALLCQGPRDALSSAAIPFMARAFFSRIVPRAARRAGMPVPVPPPRSKGTMSRAMWDSPNARAGSFRAPPRAGRIGLSAAEALQAGQVGADFLGYGIMLGAIMGLIGETAYATARAAQGEAVSIRSPEVNHAYARLIGPTIQHYSSGRLWHAELACRVLGTAWIILADPERYPVDLVMLAWAAYYTAIEVLQWDQHGVNWRELWGQMQGAEWTPPPLRDPGSIAIAHAETDRNGLAGPWPVRGSPPALGAEQLVTELGPRVATGFSRFAEQHSETAEGAFVTVIAGQMLDRLWTWLEGTPHQPRWSVSPDLAVWESLWNASRWVIMSDPPEALARFWQLARERVVASGRKLLDQAELDQLGEEAGTPLLRLIAGDQPVPAETFLPWQPETGGEGLAAVGRTVDEARTELDARIDQEEGPESA